MPSDTPLAHAVDAFLADQHHLHRARARHAPGIADDLLMPTCAGLGRRRLAPGGDILARRAARGALSSADLCQFLGRRIDTRRPSLALAAGAGRPRGRGPDAAPVDVRRASAGPSGAGLDSAAGRPRRTPAPVPARLGRRRAARPPDLRRLFLVEPSYVGMLSDLEAIAAVAHEAAVPLIVDQAWGAHLGFHPALPPHAIARGADAMVTSTHKTLTGLHAGLGGAGPRAACWIWPASTSRSSCCTRPARPRRSWRPPTAPGS